MLKPVKSNHEPPRPRALGPVELRVFAVGAALSSLKISVRADVFMLLN